MGPAPAEPFGLPPKQRKTKSYQVLGDVNEFQERLAATLTPPKPPPPPNAFTIQDTSEFPPEIWFAATISPDNGVAVIASFRELSKTRALYQQQLTHIHTARKQHGMGNSSTLLPLAPLGSQGTVSGSGSGITPILSAGGPSSASSGEPPVNRTIAETLRMGAETRMLGKFDLQQQKWDEVTATLATRLGRPPQELAMQRGPAWRTRAELTELLYRAQPPDARGLNPDEVFLTSLRDAWERVIPLGSIFTGLSLHIKEKPHELPATRAARVGRPLDPLGLGVSPTPLASLTQPGLMQQHHQSGSAGSTGSSGVGKPVLGRSLSARGRSWEDGEVLHQRVVEYGSRLRALAPHDPEFGSLVVAGEALEGQLDALARCPISLAEVEAHMRDNYPESYTGYRVVKDEMETQLRAALEAEEAQRAAREADARAAAPQPGPHVTSSHTHLCLLCHTGERAHGSVTLTSNGTAMVWWRWQRWSDPQPAHSATEVGQPQRFISSQQSGTLLPGQSLELSITFIASSAGTFRETWQLVTTPALQGSTGPTLTLHLRGLAELRDQSATGRTAVEATLQQREKMAKVAAAVERVLRDVRMPRRPALVEVPEELALADAWDRANGCCVDGGTYAWPPVFFSMGVQSELAEVYKDANAALTVSLAPPPEEEGAKKTRKGTAERRHKKLADEPPPPPPKYPAVWDGTRLSTLDALLAELATVAPAVAMPLQARTDAAKARAHVAPNGRRLARRAIRSLVLRMVEGVDERLSALRADLEAKAEAEAAALAAAAAAAAEADGGEGGHGGELFGPESSLASVATTATHGGGKAAKEKGGKGKGGKDKGGKDKGGQHGNTAGDAGGPLVAGSSAHWDTLLPVFHDKAMSGARMVVKSALNSLTDEVLRHKAAVGDALEANIRVLDEQIAAEQLRLRQQQQQAAGASSDEAAPAAEAASDVLSWYAPPAGGVPAPSPGPPAAVRSPLLEQLYWDRLGVLRTWTSLGIPNRGNIR